MCKLFAAFPEGVVICNEEFVNPKGIKLSRWNFNRETSGRKGLIHPTHTGDLEGGHPSLAWWSPDTLRHTLKRNWKELDTQRRGGMRWNLCPATVPQIDALFHPDTELRQKADPRVPAPSVPSPVCTPSVSCLATGSSGSQIRMVFL